MVTRVTTAQRFNIALRAIQRTQSRVQDVQTDIVTGKRIQRPSDDPASFAKIVNIRRLIGDTNQFGRNIETSRTTTNVTDVTLQKIRDIVLEARTIAVEQAGAPSDAITRTAAAIQISKIRESLIQLANTQVGQRYIFSGTNIFTQAYSTGGEYLGNQGELDVNVAIGSANAINVVGSNFLTTDLDPDLYISSALAKSATTTTDEFVIGVSNNGLVIRDQPSATSTTVTLASATYTGDQLATEATLKINNSIKVVTATNNTIEIVEDGGAVTDTITVAAGVRDGTTLAADLEAAINASVVLTGSTAAAGAGYTVTYNAPTDEFTITGGAPATTVGVDVTAGNDLAAVMGYTQAPAFAGLATTSDATLFGTTVSYDEINDQFTIQRTGVTATDFEVLSAATDATSTAAVVFGFTADSAQGTSSTSDDKVAFNVISATNDEFSISVDGGTNTPITALADMSAMTVAGHTLGAASVNDASGALVPLREYSYVVSAVDVTGESIQSEFVSFPVGGGDNAIEFSFDDVPGAVSYRIYRVDETEYAIPGAGNVVASDFQNQDSLIGTVIDNGAGPFSFLDIGQTQQTGKRALAVATGVKEFMGEELATVIQLRINNSVKEVTSSNQTIKILEDGGARSETITVTPGTKSGPALASELQTVLNASTILAGSTAAGGGGYTVTYDPLVDKFNITTASPAVSVGVEVGNDDLGALMGFTASSPFGASVTSDTSITGAKVDYNASFKDRFTITSPSKGSNSSIALTPGAADILTTLNLDTPTVVASKSTLLSDLNAGKGVESGSISVTNRAGQVFVVDLSTASRLNDVFEKIESTVTGVKASISSDGKRIVLTDSNSPQISNLIVKEVGSTKTAADLGLTANVPGNLTGQDIDPRVSNDTLVSVLRKGAGLTLGKVNMSGTDIDLNTGSKITVSDLIATINTDPLGTASVSSDGKFLKLASTDSSKSILLTDVGDGTTARDLGIQGGNNVIGLLSTLEEALLRNDETTIGKTLDEFTAALDRIGTQQVAVGEVARQFDRISTQHEEIILSFGEVLTKEEDTDLTQAITEFSIFQTSLEAAFATTAQILQVSLLDFLS